VYQNKALCGKLLFHWQALARAITLKMYLWFSRHLYARTDYAITIRFCRRPLNLDDGLEVLYRAQGVSLAAEKGSDLDAQDGGGIHCGRVFNVKLLFCARQFAPD
jgi:hypothetical protein